MVTWTVIRGLMENALPTTRLVRRIDDVFISAYGNGLIRLPAPQASVVSEHSM
jgi:hypothetical protein